MLETNGHTKPSMNDPSQWDPFNNNCYGTLVDTPYKKVSLPILDVTYEELIADGEGQSRRMVEFLGLPWDERCLAFHQTRRSVRTASIVQVRQPIYRSSLARWRRYEKHLGPLAEALKPAASGADWAEA